MDNREQMNYSIEFACLIKLKKHNLISEKEFENIKKLIRKDYNIISDLVI